MPIPFYRSIPFWIVRFVEGKTCGKCNCKINRNDIVAIGIRKSTSDKTTPYVEFSCPSCKHRLINSFDGFKNGTMEDMCYAILQDMKNKENSANARLYRPEGRKKHLGPITDREVKKFLKDLNKYSSHDEFLKGIKANVKSRPGGKNESK